MSPAKRTKQMRTAARSTPEEDPEFQIAPMIDILLVLLIFFMSISSSEVLQVSKDVILPVAKDAKEKNQAAGKGQTTINILWSVLASTGTVELDEKKYGDPGQLTPILGQRVQVTPNMRVLIRADRNVRYEYLRAVMVAAANAGVGNVTFSVVDKDSGGSAPPPAP
jgi:biopolymer transport protein ExbD